MKKNFLFLVFSLFASMAFAEEKMKMPGNFFELDIYTGPTGVTGQFSEQKNPNSWGFSANVYLNSKSEVAHPGFISVGNYNFSMVSQDSEFPFPQNQAVNFSTSFMNIMVPVYGADKFSLYLGIGYALISLLNDTDKKWVQNYGSSQYELQTRYDLSEKWCLYYKTKWQQINQYQNDKFSFIEMWSHFLGMGYMIF